MLLALFGCLMGGMIVEAISLAGPIRETDEGKFVSTVIHVAFFNVGGIACVGLLLTLEKRSWNQAFGFNRNLGKTMAMAMAVILLATPFVMFLQGVIGDLLTRDGQAPEVQQVVRTIEKTVSFDQRFFYGFLAIVLAPVIEELLFRGIFYPAIKSAGYPHLALWGTSIMFGLVHSSLLAFIPLTVFAVILAKLYDRTGNLFAPIITHCTFNGINFILVVNRSAIERWITS